MKNHSDEEDDDGNRKLQVELSHYLGGMKSIHIL